MLTAETLALVRLRIDLARMYFDCFTESKGSPIEAAYFRARSHAALYSARLLLNPHRRCSHAAR